MKNIIKCSLLGKGDGWQKMTFCPNIGGNQPYERFANVATNYKSNNLMQRFARNRTYASYGHSPSYTAWYLPIILLLFCNFVWAQEPCPAAYVIGDPNNPNSQTWFSETEIYAAHPDGLYGNGDSIGCVYVYGKLKMNRNYVFDNCTFVMGEKAEIEVRSNIILRIKNGSLLYGREKMWKGISLNSYRAGLDMENSTLKDAQYAVKAGADVTRLRLVNNTFDANYVGLYSTPFGGIIGGKSIQKMGGNNYFKDNRFVFDSPYLPPYTGQWPSPGHAPYAAIEVNDVVYFNIGIPGSDAIANYIENIQYGVINRGGDDGLTISINQYSGFRISHPDSLYSNSVGFLIDNTPISVNVMGNYIEQVTVGVRSVQSQKKIIRDNTIRSTKQCISIANEKRGSLLVKGNRLQSQVAEGVLILGCKIHSKDSYYIEENEVTLLGNSIGISVYDTEGSLNIINDNRIKCQYMATGGGQNRGIQLVRTLGPTTIKENTITSFLPYKTGLGIGVFYSENTHVSENRVIGEFGSGIHLAFSPKTLLCCNQVPSPSLGGINIRNFCQDTKVANTAFKDGNGTSLLIINGYIGEQLNTGNDWTGATNAAYDAMYIGDSITASAFFTDPALVPNGHEKISVPFGVDPQEWFTFEGTDPTCEMQVNCGVMPFIEDDPIIQPYLTDDDWKVVVQDAALTDDKETMVLLWEAQKYLYGKLVENPSLMEADPAFHAFYQQASNGPIGQMYTVQKGIVSLKSSTAELDAKSIGAINSALSPANPIQQNEKDINAIYLATVAQGIFTFTAGQMATVSSIADQCPYTEGAAVLLARTLKQYYEPGWHWPIDECMPVQQPVYDNPIISNNEEQSISWAVFPNPARSFVNIKFHEPISTSTPLNLLDATGQVVAQQQMPMGVSETMVNLQGLPAGIYFVKMQMDNGEVLHSRIAVVD